MDYDTRDVRNIEGILGIDTFVSGNGDLQISINMPELMKELFSHMYIGPGKIVMTDEYNKLKLVDTYEFRKEIAREIIEEIAQELKTMHVDTNLEHSWSEVIEAIEAYKVTRKMVSD